MTEEDRTVSRTVHFATTQRGKGQIRPGPKPTAPDVKPGRLPRVTRLMALAIRFEELLKDGTVKDYADLARLGGVSRARITQIMNLRLLAPDIQEKLLFHERINGPQDTMQLRDLQAVALEADWALQRLRYSGMATGDNTAIRSARAATFHCGPAFAFFESALLPVSICPTF